MPELNQTTALPEGLTIGSPISQHHGIRCCPAVQKDANQEYFLKIIPIPANPDQAQALILSGICNTDAEVTAYYQNQCDSLLNEVSLLQKLHDDHAGFLPFYAHQSNKHARGVGFQVTLLSSRRDTLDIPALTVRQALDFATDICDALTACRDAGYLYINLKPSNIFRKGNGKWCIGDVGFLELDALSYAILPEKYQSDYTAPEILDTYSQITPNADVYALGMLMYQIFNGGNLPQTHSDTLSAPLYADYLLWDIVEKACHGDPAQRWQTPADFKQAIVQYRREQSGADCPIVPLPETTTQSDTSHKTFLSEEENEALLAPMWDLAPDESNTEDDFSDLLDSISSEDAMTDEEDVASMMAQVDDLIQHQPPQPVVAPVAYEVNLPVSEPETPDDAEPQADDVPQPQNTMDEFDEFDLEIDEIIPPQSNPVDIDSNDSDDTQDPQKPKKTSVRKVVTIVAIVSILLAAIIGGIIVYYNVFYTQSIDGLQVNVLDNSVIVTLDTDTPDNLLRIVCADSYGNAFRSNITNGQATISGLNPGTQYDLSVEISGFHRLIGQTRTYVTTASRTEILNLSAVCGQLDGSVILSFAIDGAPCNIWTLHYSAIGQEEQTISFSGTSVTVTGLTVGQTYSFRISAHSGSMLSGVNEIQFTAKEVVAALDLTANTIDQSTVALQWSSNTNSPAVWQIRCYNNTGYDQTYTTTQTFFNLTNLDLTQEYTVLITAEGNTRSELIHLTPVPADTETELPL